MQFCDTDLQKIMKGKSDNVFVIFAYCNIGWEIFIYCRLKKNNMNSSFEYYKPYSTLLIVERWYRRHVYI